MFRAATNLADRAWPRPSPTNQGMPFEPIRCWSCPPASPKRTSACSSIMENVLQEWAVARWRLARIAPNPMRGAQPARTSPSRCCGAFATLRMEYNNDIENYWLNQINLI